MIEESVRIHDKFQFEVKFSYRLDSGNKSSSRYNVDTYIFIPNSLGVNPDHYGKDDFYQDVQSYIRLKTPAVLMRDLNQGDASPMQRLEQCVKRLSSNAVMEDVSEYTYRLKLFCSIFRSALRDEKEYISRQTSEKDVELHVTNYLKHSQEALQRFRALRKEINLSTVPDKCLRLFQYADEYLSLQINDYRRELFEVLQHGPQRRHEKFAVEILKLAREEISYRKESGYLAVPEEKSTNEKIIFRRGALKKFVSSVLFLYTRRGKEGVWIEQILFGLAAATAMAFATTVLFLSKSNFGELTLAFFILLVLSYIFKDRMKDSLKSYISIGLRRKIFDRKTTIRSSFGKRMGHLREKFMFIDESSVPKQISQLRKRDFMADIDEDFFGEKIMLYRKKITLFPENFGRLYPDSNIDGVNDIIRMNLLNFTRRMDNPFEDVFIPKKSDYQKTKGTRVYHLNIILRYNIEGGETLFNMFRIVFNRNGIKRVEKVA